MNQQKFRCGNTEVPCIGNTSVTVTMPAHLGYVFLQLLEYNCFMNEKSFDRKTLIKYSSLIVKS